MPRAPKRVLVTRPEPGASQTARRLQELGFVPVKLPLPGNFRAAGRR